MFDHAHHQLIHRILKSLDADLLSRAGAHFGGGTYVTLRFGEYRWSKDVDFICPFGEGYRLLRGELDERGIRALFPGNPGIEFPREPHLDQYGLRFPVVIDGTAIKFEIIAEGRIALDPAEFHDWADGVPCLSLSDCFAEKLLANADRWADRSVESRDLIDLAMLRAHCPIPEDAWRKAETAYPVQGPLKRALEQFRGDHAYRRRCYEGLEMSGDALVQLANGLDLLAEDMGLGPMKRLHSEAGPTGAIGVTPGG